MAINKRGGQWPEARPKDNNYCSDIYNVEKGKDGGILNHGGGVLPMLMKAALDISTCHDISSAAGAKEQDTNGGAAATMSSNEEEPDDSLLYAVVIGLLYAFIMAFLILANLHPSRSLLSDLEQHDSLTDVNLNEDLPFEFSQLVNLDINRLPNSQHRRDSKATSQSSGTDGNCYYARHVQKGPHMTRFKHKES